MKVNVNVYLLKEKGGSREKERRVVMEEGVIL